MLWRAGSVHGPLRQHLPFLISVIMTSIRASRAHCHGRREGRVVFHGIIAQSQLAAIWQPDGQNVCVGSFAASALSMN